MEHVLETTEESHAAVREIDRGRARARPGRGPGADVRAGDGAGGLRRGDDPRPGRRGDARAGAADPAGDRHAPDGHRDHPPCRVRGHLHRGGGSGGLGPRDELRQRLRGLRRAPRGRRRRPAGLLRGSRAAVGVRTRPAPAERDPAGAAGQRLVRGRRRRRAGHRVPGTHRHGHRVGNRGHPVVRELLRHRLRPRPPPRAGCDPRGSRRDDARRPAEEAEGGRREAPGRARGDEDSRAARRQHARAARRRARDQRAGGGLRRGGVRIRRRRPVPRGARLGGRQGPRGVRPEAEARRHHRGHRRGAPHLGRAHRRPLRGGARRARRAGRVVRGAPRARGERATDPLRHRHRGGVAEDPDRADAGGGGPPRSPLRRPVDDDRHRQRRPGPLAPLLRDRHRAGGRRGDPRG
ncbi:hypothetical protein CMMCAS04_11210 [Clavibacter michiganensis subsp. michiganensis]|nr:hypothetical protein CMMCAS04_11210 [Clavibacter michiganensis subsp. michiganensis]